MADTLKQVQIDRQRMIENNKGATESSRAALSAISGRLVLKTKTETEKMRRDEALALRQNEALVALNRASGNVALEKSRLDAAQHHEAIELERDRLELADRRLGLRAQSITLDEGRVELERESQERDRQRFELEKKRQKKNEVLTMMNQGVYDPSFATVLGMPEDVVRQVAANKKAQLDQIKAARAKVAQAQADYEAALAARDENKPKEPVRNWYEKDVDTAIKNAEKDGKLTGNAAEDKELVLSAVNFEGGLNVFATPTAELMKSLLSPSRQDLLTYKVTGNLPETVSETVAQLKEQNQSEKEAAAQQRKRAAAYYDQVLTEKIYAKEKANEELSALEASFKKEQEQSTAYQLRMKRFGAVDKMKNATTAEEATASYNEYLTSLDEKKAEVFKTAEDLFYVNLMKNYEAEDYTPEEREQVEQTKAELQEIKDLLIYEIESVGLTEEGEAIFQAEIENVEAFMEAMDAAVYHDDHFEEIKDELLYEKVEWQHAHETVQEIEAYLKQLEKDLEKEYGAKAKGNAWIFNGLAMAGGNSGLIVDKKRSLEADPRYQEYTEIKAYLEQREKKEEEAEQDERAGETFAGMPEETLTAKMLSFMGNLDEGEKLSKEGYVAPPDEFWRWGKEKQCEWFNNTYGTNHTPENFSAANELGKMKAVEITVSRDNSDALYDASGYFHRNIVASNEALFTPETLEQYAAQAVENAKVNGEKLFVYPDDENVNEMVLADAEAMKKYAKGIDGLFEGNYSSVVFDFDGFLKGEYGNFTEQEAKTILAMMAKYGPEEAFIHYAAVRDDALKRKAQEFTGFGRVVRGVTSGLTQFITNGGEMLENAFTQQYSRIAGTLGTASHQINMENFSQKTGIGNDALELLYMSGYSIIDMAPAVAMSVIPYAGKYLSSAYTFAKVTATTYNDSILAGKLADEALTYAMLSATAEVGMEKLLSTGGQTFAKGGLGKIWKEGVENLASTKAMQVIIKTAGSMGSEGFEEFLQECLSPFLEKVAADLNGIDDATLKEIDWEEAAKSFAIGAITGGFLGGFEAVSSSKNAGMKESEARDLLESGKAVDIINAAAELGNKRALAIKQAIQNGQALYEGQSGYFAYASPADIINITQSVKRRSVKRSMSILQEKYNALETNKDKQKTFNRLFKKILNGNTLTLQETADIINDHEMSGILNEMLGMDVTMMTPDQVLAVAKLAAFAENGKISQARINLFKDAFGELDTKALAEIVKYSDMAAKKVSGILYEDANAESQLTVAEQESAEVLKILSAEVGTVFYVTDQFETGTYLAANMMAVRPGDLAGGVSQTVLKRVYYITMQLNPKAGKTIRDLVLGELKNKYTAEAFSAAVEQIRKEMAVNGNDVSFATAENELCAREFPTMMLEGALAENLAAEDLTAVQTIRKSLYAVQSHLSDQATLSAVRGKVTFDGVDQSKLNDRQKVTVQALSVCFGTMGINVEFFESPVNAEGQHVGINGSYDPATNTIRLDIAAGIKGEDAALFTASHELTHFIKTWSEEKYQAFADFLLKKYAEHGVDVDALVQKKIEQSKNSSAYKEPLSPEAALEEVICDSCETFLRDSNLMETLSDMAKKEPSLYERIRAFFEDFLDRLRRSYQKLMPDSAEANIVLEMTGCIEELHAMWEDAALSARENALQSGMEVQKNTTEGGVKYSWRNDKNGDRYWHIDTNKDIFKGLKSTQQYEAAAFNYIIGLRDTKTVVDAIDGKKISFIRISAEEFTNNDESKALKKNDPVMFAQKMRLIPSLDDMAINSNINWWSPDHKNHKLFKERGFENFRGRVGIDNVIFKFIIRAGKAHFGDVFYDIKLEVDSILPHTNGASGIQKSTSNTNSIRLTDLKSQDISKNIFLDAPTAKTNELYHRLTALVRGEEVSVADAVESDQDPTYTDAEQVRSENDGADFVRNFEDLTPEEREAEYADLQNEIDAHITDVVLPEQIEAEEATRKSGAEDAENRVGAKKEPQKDPFGKVVKDSWNWIRRKMEDSGQAIYDIGKKIRDDYLYGYYNTARASQQAGVTMISKWQTDVTGKVVGKSLQEIWAPITAQGKEYAKQFDAYLLHLHNIDRMSRYDPEALEEARHQYEVEKAFLSEELRKMSDDEIRAIAHDRDSAFVGEAQDYINALDNYNRIRNIKDKPVFGYDVSAEDSRAKAEELERLYPEFKEYREAVYQYVDNLLQYRVDSGLISAETKAMLKKIYPHYVPTARVQAEDAPSKKHWWQREKNREQVNKAIGKAQGSDSDIISLYDQIAGQTMSVVREGSKNRFGVRLLQQSESIEEIKKTELYSDKLTDPLLIDRHLDEIDPFMTLENKNIFAVFKDGEFWEMEVTDELWEAIAALDIDEEPQNGFKKWAKWNVDTFKRLITSLNPIFAIRNPIKDIADGLFYSKDTKRWLAAMPAAIKEMKTGGELWQQYVALGGGFSTYFDFARMGTKEPRGVGKVTGRIEALNQTIEQFPRFAEFIATVRKGDGSMDNLMEAMHNAADITTNFGRSGSTGRMLNRYWIPFFNPSIQGMSKAVRAWTEQRSVKGFVALGAKAVLFGVAPAVINALLYRDDEEWDQIKQTDKDRYFLFKLKDGLWIRIPKGRMLSVFGGVGDRALQAIEGEEFEWASLIQTTVEQMAPSNPIESNILGPLFLASINRTWYGTEIVGDRLKNEPDAEQYDTKTDELSKWIGSVSGLSPKKVHYVLDAYGGIVGDVLLPALTPAAERSVFTQAFTLDTNYSNRMSGDFYDKLDELSDQKNSVKATVEDEVLYRWWNRNADTVSEINAEIRKIEEDGSLSSKEKKEKVNEQYVIRNAAMLGFEETYDRYTEAVRKYSADAVDMSKDDAKEYVYREANREIFGAEYALKAYGTSTYERAVKVRDEQGIDFDTFYDVYFDAEEPDVEKCFLLIEDGFEKETALEIARNIGALEPLDGAKSVSSIQKYGAIDAADITEDEKLWAMTVLATETDRRRLTIGADYNVTLGQFIAVKDNVTYLNDQTEGGVTNALVKAAVNDVDGLNDSQRAALWQLFTGATSGKNNPYSSSVGAKVAVKNKALKEAEK